MAKRLAENITSKYFEAANKLTSKSARRKIIAYVESYDDILFWRQVLGRFEDKTRYFEIMLPTRDTHLERGKKAAIANMMAHVGEDMIACVDADYDYVMQGRTATSIEMLHNPYILHTYVYAIENYQSYAPSLHDACVMVTLNDSRIFDFEEYLRKYSNIIYPLFLWSVWYYRSPNYADFTLVEFNKIISVQTPKSDYTKEFSGLQQKVDARLARFEKHLPSRVKEVKQLSEELLQLGITPDNVYLYVQGHHLFDSVVSPIVNSVCDRLVAIRQKEIKELSMHAEQENTELSCYNNSVEKVKTMLKKNIGYQQSEQFRQVLADVEHLLNSSVDDLRKEVDAAHDAVLALNEIRYEAKQERKAMARLNGKPDKIALLLTAEQNAAVEAFRREFSGDLD